MQRFTSKQLECCNIIMILAYLVEYDGLCCLLGENLGFRCKSRSWNHGHCLPATSKRNTQKPCDVKPWNWLQFCRAYTVVYSMQ